MRLIVHDFAGHPFQLDLSRTLARRGHEVLHLYCASLTTTPQAARADAADPRTLRVEGLEIPGFSKTNLVKRFLGERRYGVRFAARIRAFRPDVVLSANTPLDAQAQALKAARAVGARFDFWLQDLIGEATARLLARRLPVVGALTGYYYRRLEARLLRRSDAIVAITEDFRPLLVAMGVEESRMHVVENWAPVATMPLRPQDNPWSREHGLAGREVLLYAGTLGLKHNPDLLVKLAEALRDRPGAAVVVTSHGAGADHVHREAVRRGLSNLRVIGFQPFEAMPDVLATAAVLVTILEPDAGVFSVPSKVLTNLCAGRAQLLAVPTENLAARLVERLGAGLVVLPNDPKAFVAAARTLLDDAARRAAMGEAARRHAEGAFEAGT
ncbi:MAG TPA: glycosyltransferase family 4 protein, partial [Rhodothermales bacterium]|nr:glycosyltransferase family 4 protein [Rhodothermales bacterium]